MELNREKILKRLPFLGWFAGGGHLRADIIAGITVALIAVPQAMAYAQLAGLPPVYGLYGAFIPVIIAAMFSSSSHLTGGPSALSSMLTASVLAAILGADATPGQYISSAIFLAFVSGVVLLLMGFLRLGALVNFLSEPVLKGFVNAAAFLIATSQLGGVCGFASGSGNFFEKIWHMITHFTESDLPTLGFSALSFAMLICFKKYFKRLPGSLLTCVILTIAAWLLSGVGDPVVRVVGEVPQGLPVLGLPDGLLDVNLWMDFLPSAALVSLIIFMESASVGKAIAAKTRTRIDLDQQLLAQGASCLVSGLCNGYTVSASFSRSALCYTNGGKTGMSSVFNAVVVMVTLLWLTPLLYYLPRATLSAMIILSVFSLADFASFPIIWKTRKADGVCFIITFLATLFLAPQVVMGIIVGAGLSMLMYMRDMLRPRVCLVEQHPDGRLRDAKIHGLGINELFPTLRFDDRLFFANCAVFENAVLDTAAQFPKANHILIVGEGVNAIDSSGEILLRRLSAELNGRGTSLVLVGFKKQVLDVLQRSGMWDIIGEDNFFATRQSALEALAKKTVCAVGTDNGDAAAQKSGGEDRSGE